MIAVVALTLAFAASEPVGLVAGEAAPFDGVLIDADRAGDLVLIEAEATALRRQLEEQQAVSAAWKAAAQVDWTESPELHRWLGFAGGVVVAVGAIVLGAWAVDTAAD